MYSYFDIDIVEFVFGPGRRQDAIGSATTFESQTYIFVILLPSNKITISFDCLRGLN